MADAPESQKAKDALQQAVANPDVPKIYTNGFSMGLSNADIIIVLQRFGTHPVAVINLSYTLAKTLAQRLGSLVADLERQIDQQILTTDRIDEAMTKPDVDEQSAAGEKKTSEVH